MIKKIFKFSNTESTQYCFNAAFDNLSQLIAVENAILITDKLVYTAHKNKLKQWSTIVLPFSGEQIKTQQTVNYLIRELIKKKVDKSACLIGMGGGTITDLVGYVAAIYMRSISVGFVPTTLLAMVDAAVGGKNGVNYNRFKNIIGTTYQPDFVLYDYDFLNTLPRQEWISGFAEMIKHACIKNATMLQLLSKHTISFFQKNKEELARLIQNNVLLKLKIVQQDEQDKASRHLLNFGHTIGHALERVYKISHGQAIAIGMAIDCTISEKHIGFKQTREIVQLLKQYELPTSYPYNKKALVNTLQMDKKKEGKNIQYVLLEKIGKGCIEKIPIAYLIKWL